jgi:cell division transport system permease protein
MSATPNARPRPIIPPEAAPLRTLTVTMAVMCYLACLAIGALILINQAVDGWTRGLSHEVTIQVRDIPGADVVAELEKARLILEDTKGISGVDVLDRDQSLKLLEPWLGKTQLDDLPVPRLIRVTVDDKNKPDFAALEQTLKSHVQGVGLDTHQRWAVELTRMAATLTRMSWLILLLICASAVAVVIFATRAVLDANRRVVNVLHLVGARDGYIAQQIDRRFIETGLWAGLIGVVLGLLTFFAVGSSGPHASNGLAAAASSLLFAPGDMVWRNYLALFAVPVFAILIALITSRITLMRMLRTVP